jgi:hypothetical protein
MPMDWGLARDYAARDVKPEDVAVTEAEWLEATDPVPILESMRGKASDRRLRLFAVACCRRMRPPRHDAEHRLLIETAEACADETRSALHSSSAYREVTGRARERLAVTSAVRTANYLAIPGAFDSALNTCRWAASFAGLQAARGKGLSAVHANQRALALETAAPPMLLRDVFGNPFRSVPAIDFAWLTRQGGSVMCLARAAYEERNNPEGTLDLARLALLADALEDTGCTRRRAARPRALAGAACAGVLGGGFGAGEKLRPVGGRGLRFDAGTHCVTVCCRQLQGCVR